MLESLIVNTDRSMGADPKDTGYEELRIVLDDDDNVVEIEFREAACVVCGAALPDVKD